MNNSMAGIYLNMLIATGQFDNFNSQIEKMSKTGKDKIKVVLGKRIKKTSGGHHAWYESNVGVIRKPIQ